VKSKKLLLFILLTLSITVGAVLNIKVTTRQGINYHVSEIEIPLYLKMLNFYDRHFNYKWLVERVTENLEKKEEKVFRLFEWTYNTIHPQPESLPIMDDHVWSVYVRGYGVEDNFHDLFTTLCNYIDVDSFFHKIESEDLKKTIYLSLVKLEKGWVVFDPYNGAYFVNKRGGWATVDDIQKHDWKLEKLGEAEMSESFYRSYLENLPIIDDIGLKRSNTQSPINRFLLAIKSIGFS
jgi:hypothetical protein